MLRGWIVGIAILAGCAGACAPQPAAGTLEDPVHPGDVAEVGGYEFSVLGVVPDAQDDVVAENTLNDPPPPGRVYPLVRMRATRVDATTLGNGSGIIVYDMSVAMVAPDGTVFDRAGASCGYVPDDAGYLGLLESGNTAEFNVCRAVPPEQLSELRVWMHSFRDADDPGVYFALPPAAPSV